MHRRRHELDDDEQRNNHVRHKKWVIEQGMEKFIREEVDYQEQLEAAGYRSPTLKVLRALQSLLAAEQLQGESTVTTPPFPPSAGRGTVQFYGGAWEPTVFLWDGLDEAGRELCADVHTKRLGGVESSATDQGRPHTKGVRTSGQNLLLLEGQMQHEGARWAGGRRRNGGRGVRQ